MTSAERPSLIRRGAPVAILVAIKLAVSMVVWIDGFRAVSDDDYARVTLAQSWALDPKLDPTGTSWLPVPFWIYGAAMTIFGRSLEVAQVTAWILGVLSILVVYDAARRILADDGKALVAALLAAVVPWSARLGVATVPELPVAALTLWAVAAIVPRASDGRFAPRPVLGGLALLAACLGRYEPWPVAAAFAGLVALDCVRGRVSRRHLAGAALALAGPALWIAHNAHAHGDPFAFVARVTNYKRALGGDESGVLERLVVYPATLVTHEPELFAALAIVAAAIGIAGGRGALGGSPWDRFRRPAALCGVGVLALALAAVRDGAPTHHPERAVLVVLLLATVVGGDLFVRFKEVARRARRPRALTLFVFGAIVIAALGAIPFRIIFRVPGDFAQREPEIAAGRLVAANVPEWSEDRVFLEVTDFGYFAVMAGSGRPEMFILDRTPDPREAARPSSFEDEPTLRARMTEVGATWAMGHRTERLARPTELRAIEPGGAGQGGPGSSWVLWAAPR